MHRARAGPEVQRRSCRLVARPRGRVGRHGRRRHPRRDESHLVVGEEPDEPRQPVRRPTCTSESTNATSGVRHLGQPAVASPGRAAVVVDPDAVRARCAAATRSTAVASCEPSSTTITSAGGSRLPDGVRRQASSSSARSRTGTTIVTSPGSNGPAPRPGPRDEHPLVDHPPGERELARPLDVAAAAEPVEQPTPLLGEAQEPQGRSTERHPPVVEATQVGCTPRTAPQIVIPPSTGERDAGDARLLLAAQPRDRGRDLVGQQESSDRMVHANSPAECRSYTSR